MKDRSQLALFDLPPDVTLNQLVERAICLLRENCPSEGYYLAFSGGKDSCVIKKLAQLAGVKFDAWYNNTTIDPPELVRFIKQHHSDVGWNTPKHGNMLHRIATAPKVPPTRSVRWCCEEYKEHGGKGRVKVMGVRAEESPRRALRWREVAEDRDKSIVICPIVGWTGTTEILPDGTVMILGDVWDFIRQYDVPYCSLYDEGRDRIGCVGCMLQSSKKQASEFRRWPRYLTAWKRAIIANWENWHNVPRKDGKPRYHAKFQSGEDFWQWWLTAKAPDYFRDDCQSGTLWTNVPEGEEEA